MKKSLTKKELIMIASMLFGMFFGAGNLIFPIHMGQLAGKNIWIAFIGFLLTGVTLPILGVAAIGISHSEGLYDLSKRVSKKYAVFFTCLLYLTIGPLFAIPRCATTSFSIGFSNISDNNLYLLIFSLLFFSVVLFFSLKPSKIMVWIGKYLNPIFLTLFSILIIVVLTHPSTSISSVLPDVTYSTGVFFKGFLEGYNTMDALAGVAFGIVVVESIKGLNITNEDDIALNTLKAGIICAIIMAVIYLGACLIGVQSRGLFEISENGGIALSQITNHYLGNVGQIFLAALVTFACVKTAIGLITSISETFSKMFTHNKYYNYWAMGFVAVSFLISNVGLSKLITLSVPVLQFLYPLTMTLILLNIFSKFFHDDQRIYISVTAFTMIASILDLLKGLNILVFDQIATSYLPLYQYSLEWVPLSLLGLVIGIIICKFDILK